MRRNGVAILIRLTDDVMIEVPDFKSERILALHATIESFPIRIISTYSQTNVSDDSEKEEFYDQLNESRTSHVILKLFKT